MHTLLALDFYPLANFGKTKINCRERSPKRKEERRGGGEEEEGRRKRIGGVEGM